jgi:hypothetical protein
MPTVICSVGELSTLFIFSRMGDGVMAKEDHESQAGIEDPEATLFKSLLGLETSQI